MREMGFKKARNLIPGSVPTIQTQRPAEDRKRPMEVESEQPEVVKLTYTTLAPRRDDTANAKKTKQTTRKETNKEDLLLF